MSEGRTRVLTIGTFDILHPGHLELLEACRNYDDGHKFKLAPEVIVGLNKDEFVERFKGAEPIMTYAEREACLLACRYVDAVVPNLKGEDASAVLDLVRPHVLAVGSDWLPKERYLAQIGERAAWWLKQWSVQLVFIPRNDPPQISTTIIKKRVVEQYHQNEFGFGCQYMGLGHY